MQFKPKTKEQVEMEKRKVCPGIYDYIVTGGLDTTTKQKFDDNGNALPPKFMMVLELSISNEDYRGSYKAYIGDWNLFQFCESAGDFKKYNTGEMESCDTVSFKGKCRIDFQKNNPDYTTIDEWVPKGSASINSEKSEENKNNSTHIDDNNGDFDDDIPF